MEHGTTPSTSRRINTREVFDLVMQLLVVGLLISFSYRILEPFITPLVWAAILAITLYPLQTRLAGYLGGRRVISAILITLLCLVTLIVPLVLIGSGTVTEIGLLRDTFQKGQLGLPTPAPSVKDWPLFGEKIYDLWSKASSGLGNFLEAYPEQVKEVASSALGVLASTGKAIVLLGVSILLSGVLLTYAEPLREFSTRLVRRLSGSMHNDLPVLAAVTVRKVVKGIVGVALIQSVLATIGMAVAGIPGAAIWGLACLFLSVVQIGIFPVVIGVVIYAWQYDTTSTAVLLTIWMLAVGLVDNILKPILLGKGAPAPMLVVFLGSIGGFLLSGFVGLFTGAVVLSLAYIIFQSWLSDAPAQ
jgi:predicted PurR-regulated permease PerM